MQARSGVMQTVYEKREQEGIQVELKGSTDREIEQFLLGLDDMLELYKQNERAIKVLKTIKARAYATLISHAPEEEIIEKIRKLARVKTPDGRTVDLMKVHAAQGKKIQSTTIYKERSLKRILQTIQNATALSQWKPNAQIASLVGKLNTIDKSLPPEELDKALKEIIQTPAFKVYQEQKMEFIQEWLKPFEAELGKPIASLSQEEMEAAMKKIKQLVDKQMSEGDLVVHPDLNSFKNFNATNHDMANGNEKTFWVSEKLMDEFILFTQAVLKRFTFLLDKQFLVFKFRGENQLYLIGFSEEALLEAASREDGNFIISPHIKPIIEKNGEYKEMNKTTFPSVGLYIDILKDTLKPFLVGLAQKIDFEFSPEFKKHFRI